MYNDTKITKFSSSDPYFYAERRLNQKSTQLVNEVKNLEGVRLELRGRRLCVIGRPTYHHREKLKSLGFKWEYDCRYWYRRLYFNHVD